ncbi:translocation/assembly module TamB domain-containing protein [Rhodosalinus sp. K401]|uniref:translocation/assembly module TamB domain-containing protein n=1 Tax=Rhodosalinus sp. K401 TaxID=3239195 RepID=UPI003523FABA
MRLLRVLLVACTAALSPLAGAAQDADDDKGVLTRFLQDSLSGAGRTVDVQGFRGALSSKATIERLTIADDEGVWLSMEGIVLDWNRAQVLRGRISVNEFAAERIEVSRPPVPPEGVAALPKPEAEPFSLPQLPVSVDIRRIAAPEVDLGRSVLGQAAVLSLTGSARLAEGGGSADIDLAAQRTDDAAGLFRFAANYDAAEETARIDLILQEGPGGIAAKALDLPGAPSLEMRVQGEGATRDLVTRIALATDGTPRLTGTVTLLGAAEDTDDTDWRVLADLGGDVTPLFAPELGSFFGREVRFSAEVARSTGGETRVNDLALSSRALRLHGDVTLNASGWPRLMAITLRIADPEGDGPVTLPVAGGDTRLRRAIVAINYDEAAGEMWTGSASLLGLDTPELQAEAMRLRGGGIISPGGAGRATAEMQLDAEGLDPADAALAEALGRALSGTVALDYVPGQPLRLDAFDLAGEDYGVVGSASFAGLETGLESDFDVRLRAWDLGRFGSLAGTELGGAAEVVLDGRVAPLSGAFDLEVTGTGDDLDPGDPLGKRLLAGRSDLEIAVLRDETGVQLRTLNVRSRGLVLAADGTVSSGTSRLGYSGRITDLGLLSPTGDGRGDARITGSVTLAGTRLLGLTASGRLAAENGPAILPLGEERLVTRGAELQATFNAETGQDWSLRTELVEPSAAGASAETLSLDARGTFAQPESGGAPDRVTADISASATGLLTDDAALSQALGREVALEGRVDYTRDGPAILSGLRLDAGGVRLSGSGEVAAPVRDLAARFEAELSAASLARFSGLLGRPIRGAADLRLAGSADPAEGTFDVTADGRVANLSLGDAALDGLIGGSSTLALEARRNAAGRLLVPRLSFDGANVTARADGDLQAVSYSLRVADLGRVVADLPGPATVQGTARAEAAGWRVAADATGPGGIAATVAGLVADSGRLDLTARGSAPLALANTALAPRRISGTARFDLAIAGPPGLDAVSGTVSTSGARFTDPSALGVIEDIDTTITLRNARAEIAARARPAAGGRVTVSGPVAISPPFAADLALALERAVLRDPGLYSTRANGRITVAGPLAGGARIAGRIALADTELRVPSSGVTLLGEIPPIEHVAPSPAVRRTLSYAGLLETGGNGQDAPAGRRAAPFELDLTISSPARIFIRGRGLDAEFGGELRLLGTSDTLIPEGGFDLIRGRLDLLGQRFALTDGEVRLQGGLDPWVRLVAETEADGLAIAIEVVGEVSEPEFRFTSTPDLPEDEVLAKLLFGRSLSELSPFQAIQLASAVSELTGGGPGLVSGLREGAGLDDLDVSQTDEGTTAVRAGKYISENIYTDVVVESDGTTELNLNLDITRSLTVRGGADNEGSSSLGIFFERDY